MEIELKPCPFCGGEISHYTVGYIGKTPTELDVQCNNCCVKFEINTEFANFPMIDGPKNAIDIWNRRADNG